MMVGAFISIFILLGAVLWKLFSIENRLLSLQEELTKQEKEYACRAGLEEKQNDRYNQM